MFDFPDIKLFKDSVHGYISIPKCFVNNLIDIEAFQRLRNIDQTGMRILYPNAKHDRFSHSLGVYHLGCKAVDTLLDNFSRERYWKISSDSKYITFWAKNKVLFLIACLLHDIGHTPFSHALEQIVLENSRSVSETSGEPQEERLDEQLAKKIGELEHNSEKICRIDAAPHEILGSMYIVTHLCDAIERVFDDLIEKQYPSVGTNNILYAEYYDYNPIIDKNDLNGDIAFIARMILGLKYNNFQPEKQIRNCFIELLNGGNFDVDKLDYVIRDTKMSGINNVSIDMERLLGSVCIVTKARYININFNDVRLIDRVALRLSNNNKNSQIRIRGQFRGIILLKKDSEVTIYKNSHFLSFLPVNHGKIKYAEHAEIAKFSEDTTIIQNGGPSNWLSESGSIKYKSLATMDGEPFDFNIHDATVVSNDFHFVTHIDSSIDAVAELNVNGACDIFIKGAFSIKSSLKFFDAYVSGNDCELILLGQMIEKEIPTKNVFNEFSVGFKKQAINVIANVLEARDYLYLWIYAHHKVMYYANFLIPIISREVLKETTPGSFPIWNLNFNDIEHIDDSYVWTAIKYYYVTKKDVDQEWLRLCADLLNRKYRLSLYKSLAEFDLLFESIPVSKRIMIKRYLLKKRHPNLPRLDNGGAEAGYLSEEFLNTIKNRADGRLNNISDIVYVDAGYKEKRLKVGETFIVTNDTTVASLDEIPLLADRVAASADTSYYFYIYYKTESTDDKIKKEEGTLLRNTLRDYFIGLFGNVTEDQQIAQTN